MATSPQPARNELSLPVSQDHCIDVAVRQDVCDLDWVLLRSWPQEAPPHARSVVAADLFCGCGGLTLGAWEACRRSDMILDVRLALDNSPESVNVYRSNFGLDDSSAIVTDICQVFPGSFGDQPNDTETKIAQACADLDLLLAGPPCQGHSDLNNNSRRDDPRNELYLKVARAAELTMPRAILVENVPTVVHDKSGAVEKAKGFLESVGYSVSETVINAFALGLAQQRKRHLLLAISGCSIDIRECFAAPVSVSNLQHYIKDLEDEPKDGSSIFTKPSSMSATNKRRARYLIENDLFKLPNELRPSCHKNKKHSYISVYGRLHWDRPAQTITGGFGSMGQGRYLHPSRIRTITPHEAARIQGIPDFYDFSMVTKRTLLHEMIGNAVPPVISALVVNKLIQLNLL